MSGRQIPRNVLNVVKSKTGKSVSEKDIQKLASGVKPSTMQSEAQLRQLIKQVSALVNVKVSESTMNDIVKAVKGSKVSPDNLEQLMKMISKK
ncbi:stage VI sporulation protein F [Paenibacillus senegalensis]|uniref:stage VI sporulation protein F n=1 Tax=Paenibacillus senegalensis TaxID=1465766 RepID=UPI0002898BF3|nr:stage VI sporulation protein F [Paenibacillus senegalensis]